MSSSQVPSIPFRNVQPKASHGKPAEASVTAATLQNTSQSFTKNFEFTRGDMIGVANNAPIRESFKSFNPDKVLRPGRSLRAFGQQNVQFNKSTQKTFAPKGDRSLRGGPRLPINPFAGQAATLGVSINAPISELAIAPSVLAVNFPENQVGGPNDTVPNAPGVPKNAVGKVVQTPLSQIFGQNYPMASYDEKGGRRNNINNVFNSGSTSLLEPNAFAPENDEQALSYTGDVLSKSLRAGGYRVAPRQQIDNEAGALAAFPNNLPFPALGAILSVNITNGGTTWAAVDVGGFFTLSLTTPSPDRSLIIREPQPHVAAGGVARGEVFIAEVTAGAITKVEARMTSVGFVPGDVFDTGPGNQSLTFTVLTVQTSAEPAEEQHDNPVPGNTLSQINPPAPKTAVNDNNGRVQYEFQTARSVNPSLSIISQDLTASATKAYFNTLSGEFVYGGFSMKAGRI